jgi:hypothetical protein
MGRAHPRRLALPGFLVAALWSLVACGMVGGMAGSGASSAAVAEPAMTSVTVTVDRERYEVGQRIVVTIENGLDVSIFAPPRGLCSIVSLSRLAGGRWQNVDSCPAFNVYVTAIPGQERLTGALGPASQPPLASGPIVIGPVSPFASGDDLTTLPTVAPWRSGDPVRVVPEGGIAPPFSATETDLVPGTYRVEFGYMQGSASGPVSTVTSEEFIVAQ